MFLPPSTRTPKIVPKCTKLHFEFHAPERVAGGLPVSLRGAWGAGGASGGVFPLEGEKGVRLPPDHTPPHTPPHALKRRKKELL